MYVYVYLLKGSGIFVSDSKQNPGLSSCCNHNYKPLGQSGIPCLHDHFETQFFRASIFHHMSQTLITWRVMHLRFVKLKTLLNNTFNVDQRNSECTLALSLSHKNYGIILK